MNKSNLGKNGAKNGDEPILIPDDDEEEDAPIGETEFYWNHSIVKSASHTAIAAGNVMVIDEVDGGSDANGWIFGVVMDMCSSCNWGGDDGSHDDNGNKFLPS